MYNSYLRHLIPTCPLRVWKHLCIGLVCAHLGLILYRQDRNTETEINLEMGIIVLALNLHLSIGKCRSPSQQNFAVSLQAGGIRWVITSRLANVYIYFYISGGTLIDLGYIRHMKLSL